MPMSQSAGNLQPLQQPPPRSRISSAGPDNHGPGGYRPHSPGSNAAGRPYPGPGRDYGPRASGRPPPSEVPLQHDPRVTPQGHERFSRVPGATGRPERLSSLPPQDGQMLPRASTGLSQEGSSSPRPGTGTGRVGNAPPRPGGGLPSPGLQPSLTAPTKPPPSKGPATFEDMGIPQGKQEGDCVSTGRSRAQAGFGDTDRHGARWSCERRTKIYSCHQGVVCPTP